MVCAVEEIVKSTLFLGKGGKCDQDAQKFNCITKCLNTFVAHCSSLDFKVSNGGPLHVLNTLVTWWFSYIGLKYKEKVELSFGRRSTLNPRL